MENNLKEETSEQKDAEVKGTEKKEEEKTSKRKVSFNFDILEDEVETPGVSVFVDDVICKLKVNVDNPNRGIIDDVYVNFPSSQGKGEEYVKKYTVDAEDISDADTVDIDELEGNRSKESEYVKSEKETKDNVPVEKGSEDNLVEKWKHLNENKVLKRYFYILYFFTN